MNDTIDIMCRLSLHQPLHSRVLRPYRFPPPQRSKLRAAVNAIREERGVTPRVTYVRGGADDPSPFDDLLLEEHDVEGCDGTGFVGFLQQVETQARQFMHEA